MEQRHLGRLWPVSILSLGGGGLGQLWGATSRAEAVATVHAAVEAGITLLDMAPRYGDGEAESVIGEAFGGHLPPGVRVTSKCLLGETPPADVEATLRRSIEASLERMRLSHLDLIFLHSNVVPDGHDMARLPEAATRWTPYARFVEVVRPTFEKLIHEGLIGAWGLTGIGHPDAIIRLLEETPKPGAVQCLSNLLDSAGSLTFVEGPLKPRAVIAAAEANGVGVMGIRAVQAGALTERIDRDLPDEHPEMQDFRRAEGFRALARELGEAPARLAHRYALSMPGVDTVVLGVKNRAELQDCIEAAQEGSLAPDLIARLDASVSGGPAPDF